MPTDVLAVGEQSLQFLDIFSPQKVGELDNDFHTAYFVLIAFYSRKSASFDAYTYVQLEVA